MLDPWTRIPCDCSSVASAKVDDRHHWQGLGATESTLSDPGRSPSRRPQGGCPRPWHSGCPWHTRIGEYEATARAQPTVPPHPPVAWPHLRRDRAEGRADRAEGGNAPNG